VLLERDPDTVRGPDLLVIRRERLSNGEIPRGHFQVAPDVAIEVLSPSDRWADVLQKVSQFLKAGVAEVWVIDPDHHRLHAYRMNDEPTVFSGEQRLMSAALPEFECLVSELFRGL
jgi:Uma2 family endonuclease